ncbi:unnamed protein product [Pleuronectes platessa]|uniref:Uncharacterized protein n=1 Tax=Pleuronectes platessa TaxID=8262 RepID=A0A9N7VA27_PLEPL|nr:unnamed protein product [Pleuronectes platessa]
MPGCSARWACGRGAALWASRAGSAGEQLMEELFQGEGGVPEAILGGEEVKLGQENADIQGNDERHLHTRRRKSCAEFPPLTGPEVIEMPQMPALQRGHPPG